MSILTGYSVVKLYPQYKTGHSDPSYISSPTTPEQADTIISGSYGTNSQPDYVINWALVPDEAFIKVVPDETIEISK